MTHIRVRQKLVSDLVSKFVGKPPQLLDSAIRQENQLTMDRRLPEMVQLLKSAGAAK